MSVLALTLLAIEFLDEFIYGVGAAAWPLVRADFSLSYVEVGLLLTIPSLTSAVVEPFAGILGDVWRRRVLILGGGAGLSLALLFAALSKGFAGLLFSMTLRYPTSGAFVYLSQATLMDSNPDRREQNMARWTLAGSAGGIAGPIVLATLVAAGLGWRIVYAGLAGLVLVLLLVAFRVLTRARVQPKASPGGEQTALSHAFKDGLIGAVRALRRGTVWRWLALLEFSNLTMGVISGFLALYIVDVVGATPVQASVAVAVWTGFGLLGDLLLLPLLERMRGLRLVRWSAALELALFPAFMLAPGFPMKVGMLAFLGLLSSGWYAVLQAQLYASMPGQSGRVMTVGNIGSLVGGLIPLGLGFVGDRLGLSVTMWLLLLGPVALLVGIPRQPAEA